MIETLYTGKFPEPHIPAIHDCRELRIDTSKGRIRVDIFDTSGEDEFDGLRQLAYPNADVVLVCYSVDSMVSFERVRTKWVPEIRDNVANCSFILLGCKVDLRMAVQNGNGFITALQGSRRAKELGASAFLECASINQYNIERLLGKAVEISVGAGEARCVLC